MFSFCGTIKIGEGMDRILKIKEIKKFNEYILQDNDSKKEYSFVLTFYDVKPKVGDILLLNENLLNKRFEDYSDSYSFEILDDNDLDVKESNIVGFFTQDKKYLLKRVYG